MKRFILLTLLSFSAEAACDLQIRDRMFRSPEQIREFKCELNFKCAERAIKSDNADPAELEQLGDYSRKNKCNDELRLADLWPLSWQKSREKIHQLMILTAAIQKQICRPFLIHSVIQLLPELNANNLVLIPCTPG